MYMINGNIKKIKAITAVRVIKTICFLRVRIYISGPLVNDLSISIICDWNLQNSRTEFNKYIRRGEIAITIPVIALNPIIQCTRIMSWPINHINRWNILNVFRLWIRLAGHCAKFRYRKICAGWMRFMQFSQPIYELFMFHCSRSYVKHGKLFIFRRFQRVSSDLNCVVDSSTHGYHVQVAKFDYFTHFRSHLL